MATKHQISFLAAPPISDFVDNITNYESCLGHGTFGVVLKTKISTDFYAVKFILLNQTLLDEGTRREFDIPNALEKHENVVNNHNFVEKKVLSVSQVDKIFQLSPPLYIEARYKELLLKGVPIEWTCIQMKLCGRSLRHWLDDHKPPKDSIFTHMKQTVIVENLMNGLKFLHDRNVIHRDLKPENIMFTTFEYDLPVKIGDFGLARWVLPEDGSELTNRVGTKWYMAPEVLDGPYSYQADLYSLGLVLWEITGLLPVNKRISLFDRLVNDGNEDLVENHPFLCDGVRKAIISCTKRKPENRIKSMDQVLKLVNLKANKIPAQEIVSRTSEELELCLHFVSSGCTILLDEVIYTCKIDLCVDNVAIIGRGSNTVIDLRPDSYIFISANHCTLSNCKVLISSPSLISLGGSHNVIKDIQVTHLVNNVSLGSPNSDAWGIFIEGSYNTLQRVKIENEGLQYFLLLVESTSTNISISDIVVTKGRVKMHLSGKNNTLKGARCEAIGPPQINCPTELALIVSGSNYIIEEIKCHRIQIKAGDVSLTNVECDGTITIVENLQGIILMGCQANKFRGDSPVAMTKCEFGSERGTDEL